MRIVSIRNGDILPCEEFDASGHRYTEREKRRFNNQLHYYAMYYDKTHREYRAIQLTHLYVKDKARFNELKNGNLLKEKISCFRDVPSAVRNSYFTKDISGKPLSFKSRCVMQSSRNRSLSKKQADRIKAFARNKNN